MFGLGSVSCACDAPCFSVRMHAGPCTRLHVHTHVRFLVPAPVQAAPSHAAQRGAGQHSWSGLLEGKAEQEISCRCFSASGNCLRFSLSKQNASFFPVGTTFPSPLGGLFMQVFIHSVVGYRQLSREPEKPLLALPNCRGEKTNSQSLGFGRLKSKTSIKKERK